MGIDISKIVSELCSEISCKLNCCHEAVLCEFENKDGTPSHVIHSGPSDDSIT